MAEYPEARPHRFRAHPVTDGDRAPGPLTENPLKTAELLEAWREATRSAKLAERLAAIAEAASRDANENAAGAEAIAHLAEQAAEASTNAAHLARVAADRAAELALSREADSTEADVIETDTKLEEIEARSDFHEAEREAQDRQKSR